MNAIEQATFNCKVLKWLKVQKPDLINLIRENYAAFLKCPFDETCNEFNSSTELIFVYNNFRTDIEEFRRLNDYIGEN